MNKQKAIALIREVSNYMATRPEIDEAVDMAIEALSAERTGKWIVEERDSIYGKKIRLTCSECGDVFAVTESAYPYERYCRYCGARMVGDTE